jgi:hypothetical protein
VLGVAGGVCGSSGAGYEADDSLNGRIGIWQFHKNKTDCVV